MPSNETEKTKSGRRISSSWVAGLTILAVATIAVGLVAFTKSKNVNNEDTQHNCGIAESNRQIRSHERGGALIEGPDKQCIILERLTTDAQRIKGLSGRDFLPHDRGMLFVFPAVGNECIWMKDMHFSIDILWLDADQKILKVEENVSPETYPAAFCQDDTKYVIELPAGTAKQASLKVGLVVREPL